MTHWPRHRLPFRRIGLAAAMLACLAGCATTSVVGPSEHRLPVNQRVPVARTTLIRVAAQQIGTPYRYGGSSRQGFDCSGLVQYVHHQVGVQVPRTTRAQWAQAQIPDRDHLMPGDLLFFSIGYKKSGHVAIYEGGGRFIHAPSSGKRVSRESLDNPYWAERLIGSKSFL